MDSRIIKFIKKHHVLTLATSKDNIPWTAHCFYAFLEKEKALVFTTDDKTRHAAEMLENQVVSGGIVLETKVVGKIRGIQLTGKTRKLLPSPESEANEGEGLGERSIDGPGEGGTEGLGERKKAKRTYLTRFPYAALMKTSLWILELETVKFTDNRLGFGKKLHWDRNSQ